MPVSFPDPVGCRLGHCAKTLFASLQGLVALLQVRKRQADRPRAAQGQAEQVKHDQAKYQQRAQQGWHYRPQQLVPRQRAAPGQVIAGVTQVDTQVVMLLHIFLFHMHAGQPSTFAQLCQFFFGQLVDEQHHGCLAYLTVGDVAVRAYGCGTEYRRPAIEQHETGYLLAGNCGCTGLVEDRLERCVYIGVGACLGGLAFEQGVGGTVVFHHEHPFVAAGAVQRFTYILLLVGPMPVGVACQVLEGRIPYGVAGQKLA